MIRKGQKKAEQLVRITPLGGLGEIGKNMTVYETRKDVIIVDCGLKFPESSMLGVDLVIPDISYLKNKKKNIRGIFVTHGHEDHKGAIPFLLTELGNPPIYATKLTQGLISVNLKEKKLFDKVHRDGIIFFREEGMQMPRRKTRQTAATNGWRVFRFLGTAGESMIVMLRHCSVSSRPIKAGMA